jgi:hypothetical protein
MIGILFARRPARSIPVQKLWEQLQLNAASFAAATRVSSLLMYSSGTYLNSVDRIDTRGFIAAGFSGQRHRRQ